MASDVRGNRYLLGYQQLQTLYRRVHESGRNEPFAAGTIFPQEAQLAGRGLTYVPPCISFSKCGVQRLLGPKGGFRESFGEPGGFDVPRRGQRRHRVPIARLVAATIW